MAKYKINNQRLSRYIASRECRRATDTVLDRISGMSKEQFIIISLRLKENANSTQSYNNRQR